jgi:hypothetical protein
LAPRVTSAFSRNITRVKVASIVERAVPTASLSPFAPSYVIAILAVGISNFPGRTINALGGMHWTGGYVPPGHRGSCRYRKKSCGNAYKSESLHSFLPSVPVKSQHGAWARIPPLDPKRLLIQPWPADQAYAGTDRPAHGLPANPGLTSGLPRVMAMLPRRGLRSALASPPVQPPGFTSAGANRLEASVQAPWTS